LRDIKVAARDASDFCSGLDEAALAGLATANRRTFRALKNVLAEIGEAVTSCRRHSWQGTPTLIGAAGPGCAR
jgi:hypothetical protein